MFTSDWFTHNIPTWKRLLNQYKAKPNLTFLEIGCYEGRATLWLVENILTHSSSRIIVIDTFEGSMAHNKKDQINKNILTNFKKNLAPYLSSKKAKVLIKKGISGICLRSLGAKPIFDFIYIDGSHIAKDVLEDSILSWRLLKKGGIMIFDDYEWRLYKNPLLRPDSAIDSFLEVFQNQYKILHIGYQIAILKKGDDQLIPYRYKPTFIGKDILKKQEEILKLQKQIQDLEKSLEKTNSDLDQLKFNLDRARANLEKIQSAKAYKIWQAYCKLRNFLKKT